MFLRWRERLEQQPSLWSFNDWPFIEVLSLPHPKRGQFLRNQRIVVQVLADMPLKIVAAQHNVHPSRITHLMNRCLAGDAESPPHLTKALIPGFRLQPGRRHKPLGSFLEPAGSAHSFQHLLEVVPGLRAHLEKLIKMSVRRSRRGQNLRVDTFHKAFLRVLRQAHWPSDRYPFAVANQGYEAVRAYFHQQLSAMSSPREPKRTILPRSKPVRIFSEMEIDEHSVDCHGSVVLELNERWEPLRLSRITLVAARCVASGAVLAAVLVLRGGASREDILALFDQLTSSWKPLEISAPGLSYPPGPSMPSELGNNFLRPALGIVRFDNAMVHLANEVREYVCETLGATFNLGVPKYPMARELIERTFKDLNLTVHRFPSTTGSYPTDPLKEPSRHQRKPPVVSLRVLQEAIHVHMAHLNRRALGNMGARSPIDVLQSQMSNHLVPLRPVCTLGEDSALVGRRELPVHYSSKDRGRPWVNFEHLQYRGSGTLMAQRANHKVLVIFDRSDIRQLKTYTLEGEYLGTLSCPRTWARFPHSITTRSLIMKLVKSERLRLDDPFGNYFDYLLEHRELPTCALELVRVSREFGDYATPQPAPPVPDSEPARETQKSGSRKGNIPDWSPSMVENRR